MITETDRESLSNIEEAVEHGQLGVLEVTDKATGEPRRLLVRIDFDGEEYQVFPLALLIDGDPFELYSPPEPLDVEGEGEFVHSEEKHNG